MEEVKKNCEIFFSIFFMSEGIRHDLGDVCSCNMKILRRGGDVNHFFWAEIAKRLICSKPNRQGFAGDGSFCVKGKFGAGRVV